MVPAGTTYLRRGSRRLLSLRRCVALAACAGLSLGLAGCSPSLARIANEKDLAVLNEYAGHEKSWVREQTALRLGTLGKVGSADALTQLLGDPDPWVRRRAAWALGRVGDRSAVGSLVSALAMEQADVQCSILCALGNIGDADALDAVNRFRDAPDPMVRGAAEYARSRLEGGPR